MQPLLRSIQAISLYFAFAIITLPVWFLPTRLALATEITKETQALFKFVRAGNMNGVERSISIGADWNRKNDEGLTPVDVAINYNNFKIAHYLLSLRKRNEENAISGIINNTLSSRIFNPKIKKIESDLLEKSPAVLKQKKLLKKSLQPSQSKFLPETHLDYENQNKIKSSTMRNEVILSKSEGEYSQAETKHINNQPFSSYDDFVSFLYNSTEASKRSLEKKKNIVTNLPINREPTRSSAQIDIVPTIPKSSTNPKRLLKMKKNDPKRFDRLISFFSNTIEKNKWIAATNKSEELELSIDQTITSSASVRTVKSDQAPGVEIIKTNKEQKSSVTDRITNFFSGTTEDAQDTKAKGGHFGGAESARITVSSSSELINNQSNQIKKEDGLVVKKKPNRSVLDRISNFFSGTTEDAQDITEKSSAAGKVVSNRIKVYSKSELINNKSDQIQNEDGLVVKKEPNRNVIDQLTNLIVNKEGDLKKSLKKDVPLSKVASSDHNVSNESPSSSVKTDQVPSVDKLLIKKETSDGLIDHLANFYFNTTEKTKRPLKTDALVISNSSLIVPVEPEFELLPKQVKPEIAKAEPGISKAEPKATKIFSIPSNKFIKAKNNLEASLGTTKDNTFFNMDRRINPVLGNSLRLGKKLEVDSNNVCINKGSDNLRFCVEDVNWPKEITMAFKVRSKLFHGTQALVEYSKGKARQVHVSFLARYFDDVVTYFTKRFGGAGRGFDNVAILPAEPNRKNPTIRWRGSGNSILEIRQIDDLRWSSIPDTNHGVVRIYYDDPAPIFRYVSWSDFTLARMLGSQKKFCKEANVKPCPW